MGATGVTGPTGSAGAGAIIPFASGTPVTLTTSATGGAATVGLIGFGSSTDGISVSSGVIDLTASDGGPNYAFSMPVNGTITSIAAYFSTSTVLSLTGTVTIEAQLYSSTTPDNTFTAIPGAFVALSPTFTSVIAPSNANGITTGLSIPVTEQTRLLMVFSCSATGATAADTVTGYASAGISIAAP
jgi:BclB C-terminal domain-containing protein